jgi:single-strand DNA-binding protein
MILVGNAGKDAELRMDQSGNPICKFSVATSERWTGKDGEKKQSTAWHNIVAFGRLAEICGQYVTKGKQLYVEGRAQTREYEGKDGELKFSHEVVALEVKFLGKSSSSDPVPVPVGDADDDLPY